MRMKLICQLTNIYLEFDLDNWTTAVSMKMVVPYKSYILSAPQIGDMKAGPLLAFQDIFSKLFGPGGQENEPPFWDRRR